MVKAWIWKLWRRLWRGSGGALEQELEELAEDLENDLEEARMGVCQGVDMKARMGVCQGLDMEARLGVWQPAWCTGARDLQQQGQADTHIQTPDGRARVRVWKPV